MRKRVPLLRIDGHQVVNIPEEFEFDTDDVVIYRRGDVLVVEPRTDKATDESTGADED